MARYFRCVALPLILVVGWMPWAHAEDTAKAGSNGSEATLGPVFSKTGPDATLYGEAALALLHPSTRALGPVLISQLQGALLGAPLPVSQSFLLIWPQLTGLIAATIVIFVAAYIAFQRQEIRA